jgi:O-antigen/teichoic acid export membrane protein
MFSSTVFLVGSLLGRRDVGLYSAAQRPVIFAAGLTGLLLVSFLASYSAAAPADSARLFHRTVRLGAAAVPLAVAVSAASGLLVRLVYGASYAPAAPALALLVWVVPVLLLGGPYGLVLIAANRQGTLLRNNVVGAALTVVGTLTAVPATGIVGAAAVAVAAQVLVVVLNYRTSVGLGLAPRLGTVLHALPGTT